MISLSIARGKIFRMARCEIYIFQGKLFFLSICQIEKHIIVLIMNNICKLKRISSLHLNAMESSLRVHVFVFVVDIYLKRDRVVNVVVLKFAASLQGATSLR